jgi:hypothetical protein
MPDIAADTLCIVLAPHPQSLPEALVSELSRRRWRELARADELEVMAELALHERMLASRSAWGLERYASLALIVVDPPHWRRLRALLTAVRTYLPGASVWEFADGNLSQAGPVSAQECAGGVNTQRSDHVQYYEEEPGMSPGPTAITREELDMLLSGGQDDQ